MIGYILLILSVAFFVISIIKSQKSKPPRVSGKEAVTGSVDEMKEFSSPYYIGKQGRTKVHIKRTHYSCCNRHGNENMARYTVKGINPKTNKQNTVHIDYAKDDTDAIAKAIKKKELVEPFEVVCDGNKGPSEKQTKYMYGVVDDIPWNISCFDASCILNLYETGMWELPAEFLAQYADNRGIHISAFMSARDICIRLMRAEDTYDCLYGLMAWLIHDSLVEIPNHVYDQICRSFAAKYSNDNEVKQNITKLLNAEYALDELEPRKSGRLCIKVAKQFLKQQEQILGIVRKDYIYVDKR